MSCPRFRARSSACLASLLVIPLVAACGGQGTESAAAKLEHIHGLGVNPADDTLYVATHHGVFTVVQGRAELVADRVQDTMGFAITGPDRFLGSGHPADISSPNPLGLIESTDRAATWTPLSFSGKRDFHAIDFTEPWIYAYSADQGTLIRTRDTKTWQPMASVPLIDIAADPANANRVLATTPEGVLMAFERGAEPQKIGDTPPLTFVDWNPGGVLVGLGFRGEVWISRDGGQAWSEGRTLPGRPEALSVDADIWYAATTSGIFASSKSGRAWRQVLKTTG